MLRSFPDVTYVPFVVISFFQRESFTAPTSSQPSCFPPSSPPGLYFKPTALWVHGDFVFPVSDLTVQPCYRFPVQAGRELPRLLHSPAPRQGRGGRTGRIPLPLAPGPLHGTLPRAAFNYACNFVTSL